MHKMVITWWCWHICKGEVVGVNLDQLGEEKEVLWWDQTLVLGRTELYLGESSGKP